MIGMLQHAIGIYMKNDTRLKRFIRGEGLMPNPLRGMALGRESNSSSFGILGIKPETNSSGERNTLLAAGYFIKKGLVVAGVIGMFAGPVSCEMSPEDQFGIPDIKFEEIDTNWSQDEVTNKIKLAVSQLSAQSQTIRSQYADWKTELRKQLGKDNDEEVLTQISFANSVQNIQIRIQNAYQNNYPKNDIDTVKTRVAEQITDLIAEISSFIKDPKAKQIFETQVTAFQMAHYMEQRQYLLGDEKAAIDAEFAEICQSLTGLGQSVPQSSPYAAINTLKTQLFISVPKGAGEDRNSFLQQFEDFAQFDSWTADLAVLGYNMSLPRTSARYEKL